MESGYLDRSELLFGGEGMARIRAARVLVVGVGGVGSWCAEALVRSGVEDLTIADCDRVAASNVNRQLPATALTVGEWKVDAMARRLGEINPGARIRAARERYEPGTEAEEFRLGQYDAVVDAIDSVDCKADLILSALEGERTALFSSMGAALKRDVFKVRTSEFWKVEGDKLAKALRMRFKKLGRKPARKFACVWSAEPAAAGASRELEGGGRENGSVVQVTGTFGLALASLALEKLARGEE